MAKKTKAWLLAAVVLVLGGCMLFAGVMTGLGWDFTKLSTVSYETNTHEIQEAFDSISIHTGTADVVFAPSEKGTCTVVCREGEAMRHSVSVEDGILTIAWEDKRSASHWIGSIGLHFESPEITVFLPEAEYAALTIREDTGDISIPGDFSFREAALSASTGDLAFGASVSGRVQIQTSSGDIRVEKISAGTLELSTSTGDVSVLDVTCEGDISVGVSTGRSYLSEVA